MSTGTQTDAIAGRLGEHWDAWLAGGALCSEMEASALYVFGVHTWGRAGGVRLVHGHADQRPMNKR